MGQNEEMSISKNKILIGLPGQRLCRSDANIMPGIGTYEFNGYLHASKSGVVHIDEPKNGGNVKVISVFKPGSCIVVPCIGSVVTARVLVTGLRFVKCAIIAVGNTLLDCSYRGLLRKEDVRETEKDRVDIYKCFKPGDIILARVINQLEQSLILSTAENELGVVIAYASDIRHSRIPMVPLGWEEMQCPHSLIKEPRKVAKVLPSSALEVEMLTTTPTTTTETTTATTSTTDTKAKTKKTADKS